tara:strand:+ start:4569 stop:5345 length:777 start_codon:yes stop_codon:yes gene_type:complete
LEKRTVIITQARTGSKRFPNKILQKINDKTLLDIHLYRLKKATKAERIIIATTTNTSDNIIEEIGKKNHIEVFRGSEDDVLGRFWNAIKNIDTDYIVRVTSDCPLIDPELIDKFIIIMEENNFDYISNAIDETFPDGQDLEIFKKSALELSFIKAKFKSHREHVTLFIKENSNLVNKKLFSVKSFSSKKNYNKIRMTVDYEEDLEVIKLLVKKVGLDKNWKKYVECYIKNNFEDYNGRIKRNEGLFQSLKNEKRTRII